MKLLSNTLEHEYNASPSCLLLKNVEHFRRMVFNSHNHGIVLIVVLDWRMLSTVNTTWTILLLCISNTECTQTIWMNARSAKTFVKWNTQHNFDTRILRCRVIGRKGRKILCSTMYNHSLNLIWTFSHCCVQKKIYNKIIRKTKMGFVNDVRDRALRETCLSPRNSAVKYEFGIAVRRYVFLFLCVVLQAFISFSAHWSTSYCKVPNNYLLYAGEWAAIESVCSMVAVVLAKYSPHILMIIYRYLFISYLLIEIYQSIKFYEICGS